MQKILFFLNILFVLNMLPNGDVLGVNYNMSNSTISTCGGNFYDSGGSGSNYGANENLTMTINPATPGQYVSINFTSLATSANSDLLYVYDGPNTSSPLMGIYSGSTGPGIIGARNSTGGLTFRFTSNASGQLAGWAAVLSCSATRVSTGNFLMTDAAVDTICSANFYDAGGSGANYFVNENKTMTFYPATPGSYMSVIFSLFATGNNSDFLFIYDGPNTSSPLVARYSGSTSPDTIVARNPAGCLTFVFTSSPSGQTTGWIAALSCSFTAGTNSGTYPITNNAVDTVCGGRFYDSGGNGNNYNANENSAMTFYPSTAGQYMSVTFSAFNIQASLDLFYIYDGPNTSSPLIGIYSGLTSPGTIGARNPAGCLTFLFTSNATSQNLGWAAQLSCSASPGSSTGVYPMTNSAVDTVCGGTFYDANGASNYSNNENTTMTFYPATPGSFLKVSFTAFSTQSFLDLFYIYDGPSSSSPLIGIYSGATSPNNIAARNASGCLTFVFTSNASTVNSGWVATLSCSGTPGTSDGVYLMSNNSVITTCGGTFYDAGGTGNYNSNASDTARFYPATAGQYVQLNFSAFITEAINDLVYIFDGPNVSSPLIAIYHNQSSPGTITARNSSGVLTIVFVSNNTVTPAGWVATISCSASPGSSATNFPMTNNAVDTVCSGTFYDSGGSPSNYVNNESKTMTFYPATQGAFLTITFSSCVTRAFSDYLYIYDGITSSAPLIGVYTGSSTPCTMTATNSAGALTFVFISSNAASPQAGWTGTFSCSSDACINSGCFPISNNAIGHSCSGTFYDSGGGSGNYTVNENSTMTFYPTSGQFVRLVFTAFQTEAAMDFLYIYDGPNTSSPLIGTYSGVTSPGTVTASSMTGSITVRFTSNNSNNFSGWAATIQCTGSVATTVWTGAGNNMWSQINNWANNCTTPTCAVDVNIPATSVSPRISSNTNVRNITIGSGATLTVDPGVTLSVCGDFSNNGILIISPTSTLLFNNGATVQNISGALTSSNKIGNLTVTKTGGSVILGSSIDIGGDLTTSNSTSVFNTSGRYIGLFGNLQNASGATTMTNLTGGTIEFKGSGLQTYSPGGVLTLNNAIINKPANSVRVSGNDFITGPAGALTLTSGKILPNGFEVAIQATSAFALNGGNNGSYVEGRLRRYITGLPGTWNFPVGHVAKGFQNASITFTTPTLITDILSYFSFWPSIPIGPISNDCVSSSDYSLLPALDNGYWSLAPSANPTSGSYNVTLNNNNYSNQGPASFWTVMQASSSAGPWSLPGVCVPASTVSNALRTGLSGFGFFSTGQAPSLLPVSLISFTGRSLNGANVLEWITASEVNNSYFTVQRSSDGIDFTDLGKVSGAGTSTIEHSYYYEDYSPLAEGYYRLIQTDFNGHFEYSNIVHLKKVSGNAHFAVCSPNPSNGKMVIKLFGKQGEEIHIRITDLFGHIVYELKNSMDENHFIDNIDLNEVSSGIYYINISSDSDDIYNNKLIIQK